MSQKLFRCDVMACDKVFKTKYSLKRHMKIHKIKKEWQCKKCHKQFALQQYLVEHDYTHSRLKPFLCNLNGCTESFRQRGKRSLHQALVHNTTKKNKVNIDPAPSVEPIDEDDNFQINSGP